MLDTDQAWEVFEKVPASAPQTPPRDFGYGHPEYHFVQGIMQMQQALGEINASIVSLRQSVDGLRAKVDDLVAWKNSIIGGVAVLGFLFAVLMFVITKFSSYITIAPPDQPPTSAQSPTALQQPAPDGSSTKNP